MAGAPTARVFAPHSHNVFYPIISLIPLRNHPNLHLERPKLGASSEQNSRTDWLSGQSFGGDRRGDLAWDSVRFSVFWTSLAFGCPWPRGPPLASLDPCPAMMIGRLMVEGFSFLLFFLLSQRTPSEPAKPPKPIPVRVYIALNSFCGLLLFVKLFYASSAGGRDYAPVYGKP